jgi:hypothetical protein
MATTALAPDLVFEEFYPSPAFWASGVKNISGFPISHVLTWAFHIPSPLQLIIPSSKKIFIDLCQKA